MTDKIEHAIIPATDKPDCRDFNFSPFATCAYISFGDVTLYIEWNEDEGIILSAYEDDGEDTTIFDAVIPSG